MGAAAGQVWLDVVQASECEGVHGRAATLDDQAMLGLRCGCPPAIVFIPDLEAYRHSVHGNGNVAGGRHLGPRGVSCLQRLVGRDALWVLRQCPRLVSGQVRSW